MKKTICEMCKKLLNADPRFIDTSKVDTGMKLKPWFKTDYKPTHGHYAEMSTEWTIRMVYGDIVFYSQNDSVHVSVATRELFTHCTVIENTNML